MGRIDTFLDSRGTGKMWPLNEMIRFEVVKGLPLALLVP
jgi:hypothetical protein